MNISEKDSISYSRDAEKDIIITIDKKENIIKFNDECEKISGYNIEDVLYKDFFEILIPNRYSEQWNNILNNVRKNKLIDDFNLPIKTRHGHEIMISWSSFPTKNYGGQVEDIGLVGKLVSTWNDFKETKDIDVKEDNMSSDFFDEFEKVIKELEKQNSELKKQNQTLQYKLEKKQAKKSKDKTKTDVVGKGLYTVSDIFGNKKTRDEIQVLMHDLDEREKRLHKLQKKLEREKLKINEKKNEFIRWREKLETLESEIESRKKWVENKQKALEKTLTQPPESALSKLSTSNQDEKHNNKDMFEQIQDCAAIVQRGVFKKINSSFSDLLGYNNNEVLDKSIFDFIDPQGFSGIEKYYLNRLKGDENSSFNTVFLTLDNKKISVEITSKPFNINGEKADILIIKKLS